MNHRRERFVVGGQQPSIKQDSLQPHSTKPSFNLEIVREAFIASTVYPAGPEDSGASSEDEFEDAVSDLEDSGRKTEPTAVSIERKTSVNDDFIGALEYTKAFYEIAQFFKFLNIAFNFVGKNVESSCEFITEVVKLHDQTTPVSLEQTLEYDEQVDHKYGIISCVLWLHRPLEFIIMLFRDLANSSDDETTAEIAKRCYLATLGRHHAWAIQQMVNVLLMTLPEKREVIGMMNLESDEKAKRLLIEVSECGQVAYERVEQLVVSLELNDKC